MKTSAKGGKWPKPDTARHFSSSLTKREVVWLDEPDRVSSISAILWLVAAFSHFCNFVEYSRFISQFPLIPTVLLAKISNIHYYWGVAFTFDGHFCIRKYRIE